jgi:hypothetical protein
MGFANLPATSDTNWSDWSFRVQFAEALHERDMRAKCGYPRPYAWDITETLAGADRLPPESPTENDKWLVLDADSLGYTQVAAESNDPPVPPPGWPFPWYAVLSSPTGTWAGHPNCLARYIGGKWTFADLAGVRLPFRVGGATWRFFRDGAWSDATGRTWQGHNWQIARWTGAVWEFSTPDPSSIFRAGSTIYRCAAAIWPSTVSTWRPWPSITTDDPLGFASLQGWLESLVTYWLPGAVADYTGVTSHPHPWYLRDWRVAAGIPAEGCGDQGVDGVTTQMMTGYCADSAT